MKVPKYVAYFIYIYSNNPKHLHCLGDLVCANWHIQEIVALAIEAAVKQKAWDFRWEIAIKMASNKPYGVGGVDVTTKLNLQCSNDSKFLYNNNVITERS